MNTSKRTKKKSGKKVGWLDFGRIKCIAIYATWQETRQTHELLTFPWSALFDMRLAIVKLAESQAACREWRECWTPIQPNLPW